MFPWGNNNLTAFTLDRLISQIDKAILLSRYRVLEYPLDLLDYGYIWGICEKLEISQEIICLQAIAGTARSVSLAVPKIYHNAR